MKIIRLIKTVRYLKFKQIFYQIKYRIFGYSRGKEEKVITFNNEFSLFLSELDMVSSYLKRFKPERILDNSITFLNESFNWTPGKWENKDTTHLWNFNLHYFEYALALASKYRLTDDIRYFNKFRELYLDWWRCFENEPKEDAWHPYTISLRIPNILICWEVFSDLFKVDEDLQNELVRSLYLQFQFLEKNQEKHLLGNHYFENLKTLYICSVFFKDEKKIVKYEKELLKEVENQILPDGMHYERSFMYHHIVLEDLIRIERASRYTDNVDFREKVIETIGTMTDCVYSLESQDTDRIPLFNDAGSGVSKSGKQLIHCVIRLYQYEPQFVSALDSAGYYMLQKNLHKLIFDCGDMGPQYLTGHGHCDALSFELYVGAQPVFVNGGTYQYQTELRSYFRSTKAHNTIQIGENEQADCWGEHRTADRFKILDVQYIKDEMIQGSVQYFNGDIVSRKIELKEESIVIKDILNKKNNRKDRVSTYFHVHPSCRLDFNRTQNTAQLIFPTGVLQLVVNKRTADLVLHTEGDICWYSEEFGKVERTSVLEVKWKPSVSEITIILERGN